MKVKDKIMFHFNTKDSRSEFWKPGNVIEIDDNYVSDLWQSHMKHDGIVPLASGGFIAFPEIISQYIEEEQDISTYIKMLKEARRMLVCYGVEIRELAFEDCRRDNFSSLPSRKNSVYLCDADQVKYWGEQLFRNKNPEDVELYEVQVSGDLFKSSDALLPRDGASYEECYNAAINYWMADLDGLDDNKSEYLFRGHIKVISKIDVDICEDVMFNKK